MLVKMFSGRTPAQPRVNLPSLVVSADCANVVLLTRVSGSTFAYIVSSNTKKNRPYRPAVANI